MSSLHGRRRALLAALASTMTAAVALGLSPAAHAATGVPAPARSATGWSAGAPASSTFIVQLAAAATRNDARITAVTAAIRAGGGRVISVQPAVGMLTAQLAAGMAAAVGRLPGVLAVSPDRVAHPLSLGFDPATQPGSLVNVTRSTGAQSLWRAGLTGAGVDVALIDTGVSPVPTLSDPGKVVVGPDLSFDSQDPGTRYLDGYGHGTHMASIIAGRETPRAGGGDYARDTGNFYGMAPDARLVSVKVGARDGAVDVSQLIAAIDWVVQNRRRGGLNIKVLNLSFGTDSTQGWDRDPLSQAAEVAARAGILVVAAGGNDGATASGLADPAFNPYVLAVGAVDTRGTDSYDDDQVPGFSQHQDSTKRWWHPDLVAPGVGIVASAVPGSQLATQYPTALIGTGFIRGSGTSQAAAVVSGAAALLWQKWPDLSAVQVRELLVDGSTPLGRSQFYEGNGELDLATALARGPVASARIAQARLGLPHQISTGAGSLQGARGSNRLTMNGVPLTGERDIFGRSWNARQMGLLTDGQAAWNLAFGTFNGTRWIGSGFAPDTVTLAGRTWNGQTWSGQTWAGQTWSGQTWNGQTWSGQTWNGQTWNGQTWNGQTWSGRIWSADGWR
jgi:serine protease AprX